MSEPPSPSASAPAADNLDDALAVAFGPDGQTGGTVRYEPVGEGPGAVIGPYKLFQRIGEGGMGAVFMAEQQQPVRRKVALKIIKPGMDSAQVIARFESERQALALMDHPNIAKVLDAGTTDSGRPFFVMELVKGVPITRFCDDRKLTPRQRLELFVPVCQAIQHAHQKGIIHRDIKPSNVLVALYDERPVPKVIDFGVAKAAGQALTDKTLMTGFGAVVGTPEYMSPEQAALNNLDIDTRSDVYSLGVLLYELLTGTTPVDRKSLGQAALLEVLRIVREVEAPRPSAKLSTIDTLANVAANRGTEPAKLSKLMKGELDWVLLKALEKDRGRRYESANGLARDIQRYLADELVEARPPSAGYRFRKFVRRHRATVWTAAAFAALLVAAAGVSLTLALREKRAKDRAEEKSAAARRAEDEARQSAADARAVLQFMGTHVLQAGAPKGIRRAVGGDGSFGLGRDVTLRAALDAAEPKIAEAFAGRPAVEGEIRAALGNSYVALGDRERGIPLLERAVQLERTALPADNLDLLGTMTSLATAYIDGDQVPAAIELLEAVRPRHLARFGPDDLWALDVSWRLAQAYQRADRGAEARALLEDTLRRSTDHLGPDQLTTLSCVLGLAESRITDHRPEEARQLLEPALARMKEHFGREDPLTLQGMYALGAAHWDAGRKDAALALWHEVLPLDQKILGPNHPQTVDAVNALATYYVETGRPAEAIAMLEPAVQSATDHHGANHRKTAMLMTNLAVAYSRGRRPADAQKMFERARQHADRLPPGHPDRLSVIVAMGTTSIESGRSAEAIPLLRDAVKAYSDRYGPDDERTRVVAGSLGLAYMNEQRWADLEPYVDQIAADANRHNPNILAMSLALKGRCQLEVKKFAEAEKALRAGAATPPTPNATVVPWQSMIGAALLGQERYAEAEPLLIDGYEFYASLPVDNPRSLWRFSDAGAAVVRLYEAWGKPDRAKEWRQKVDEAAKTPDWTHTRARLLEYAVARRTADLGPDHMQTLIAMNNLGTVYEQLGRLDQAEAVLRETVRLSRGRQDAKDFDYSFALHNLGRVLFKAGRPDEAMAAVNEFLEIGRRQVKPDDPRWAGALAEVASELLNYRQFAAAEPVARECLAAREKNLPDDWKTFNAKSILGGALLGQKKYADAEPLLLAGYEGMKQREAKIPADGKLRLTEAVERLVELYDATGKKDIAAKWRKELPVLRQGPPQPKPSVPAEPKPNIDPIKTRGG